MPAERYQQSDGFVTKAIANIESNPDLQLVVDIDHSRLGHGAGSPMPPSRVLIFSDARLESELIQHNPLVALDLPLRVLAFESSSSQKSNVIYNAFDYVASRHRLTGDNIPELAERYGEAMSAAVVGLPQDALAVFANDNMQAEGIVTIESPYGFNETLSRVKTAIESQDDTVYFGEVDFQANAASVGVDLMPSHMILFGGPGPGGKAMAKSPTLGLDAFCQKFLIWQDQAGVVRLSFNDLLALARRQQVSIAPALRVINFRLNKVFEEALLAGE
ncbi:DUF302 domain-containing protein [Halioglobus maricola]|uniref:DUF302 domain-containing protein n=1 Tax=Halioglobus maricola TaxID=2601894 RepID=UPI00147957C4|nr:DUF302 domain-containing protein [Halioglobus maricola]